MGFADVTRLALQPSALELDPAFARGMFLRDLNRTHQQGRGLAAERQQQEQADFDRALGERERASPFHQVQPRDRVFRPSENPSQYMLDAIMRDNAVAEYDRTAPQLREADRARRS